MLIVTTLALIGKWLLLQTIHNELVENYRNDDFIYFNRSSFCNIVDLDGINMLTFPIAFLLLFIFIFSGKRTSCLKNKLRGFISPILPVDFHIHIKRKFAAIIFSIFIH